MNISYWPFYSTRDKETRTKWLLWESDRFNCSCWLGRHLIRSYWMEFQNIFSSLSWFSINPNWLVKMFPANNIQSLHWTYQIGLSIQDKETRTKLLLWKRERHHFGCCLNSFLKDWFSNYYSLGRHSIPSTGWNYQKNGHKIYELDGVAPFFRT